MPTRAPSTASPQLDTRPLPPGPHLVAERGGRVEAAISLRTGELVANPFARTAELCELLRLHAACGARRAARDPAAPPPAAAASWERPRESEITVRRELRPGDLGEIVRMHGVLYPREYGLSPNMERHVAPPSTPRSSAAGRRTAAVWIVERDGEFAGSIALTDEGDGLAALRWFLFDPSVRGLGFGRRLVGELVAEAEQRGFERIWLETLAILTTAARIYRAHGFVCVERADRPALGRSRRPVPRLRADPAALSRARR